MHLTPILTTLSLALLSTANPARPDPNAMAANTLMNGVKCANKDGGNLNALITAFCRKNLSGQGGFAGVTIGSQWARGGVVHDDMKISIIGPNCPTDQKWVPDKYCEGQLTWMCATGGPHGGNTAHFGSGGCQTWKIENLKLEAVAGLAADLHN